MGEIKRVDILNTTHKKSTIITIVLKLI